MGTLKPIPQTPSFFWSYWRPWRENSDLFDSYLNYAKDTSLAKYTADSIGVFISEASEEQLKAIEEFRLNFNQFSKEITQIGDEISSGIQELNTGVHLLSYKLDRLGFDLFQVSNQLFYATTELMFLNSNFEIHLEQQKLSNLLLENIGELLKVPNSEKERKRFIELGIKYFVNARKNEELYDDALTYLLKALEIMKQDYFVLHRIGLIYLYSKKHINPALALWYFKEAAKYASIESDPAAARLVNTLEKDLTDKDNTKTSATKQIKTLASSSYEKAAFASYVLGDFKSAVTHQRNAVKFNRSSKTLFMLAKYEARIKNVNSCIKHLNECVEITPASLMGVFRDLDLLSEPKVLELAKTKEQELVSEISKELIAVNKKEEELSLKFTCAEDDPSKFNYYAKLKFLEKLKDQSINLDKLILTKRKKEETKLYKQELARKREEQRAEKIQQHVKAKVNKLKADFSNHLFVNLNKEALNLIITELDGALSKSLGETQLILAKYSELFQREQVQIGSKYAGGIVFYLSKDKQHGLVAAEEDLPPAEWGAEAVLLTKTTIGAGKENTAEILEKASHYIKDGWFNKKRIELSTAAKLCSELNTKGFSDWYLPSQQELELMYTNLHEVNLGGFQNEKYWSSSGGADLAYYRDFGSQWDYARLISVKQHLCVRAIRAF